jgi:alpha-beta hydrolase superfamily lysophospholipase
MPETKPTVLLVHGAWHTTEPYDQLLQLVRAKGYETVAPDLPSGADVSPADPPQADIEHIRRTAQTLIDSGKFLIVVAHSYGGIVATEALCGMGLTERKRNGLAGGVQSVVYVAAFILSVGECLEAMAPTKVVPWLDAKVSR